MARMKRDFAIAGALWLVLTAIEEVLVLLVEFYPAAKSDKGEEIDAVPGQTATIALRPTNIGSFQTYPMLRVRAPLSLRSPGQGERSPGPLPQAGRTLRGHPHLALHRRL